MTINDQPLRRFLQFWRVISAPDEGPIEKRPAEFQPGWIDEQRALVAQLSDAQLDKFADDGRRQYEANDATQESAESRANGLLVVVGLLNGLAAVAATSLTGAWLLWVVAFVLTGTALLYSAFATAFLAVRVGQVRRWWRVNVTPDKMRDPRLARIERAHQLYVAARRNQHVAAVSVGYLRDAQTFALITVAALALLAAAATAAALTKPISQEPVRVEIASQSAPATTSPTSSVSLIPTASATLTAAASPRASASRATLTP
jgi:hypothetical protein